MPRPGTVKDIGTCIDHSHARALRVVDSVRPVHHTAGRSPREAGTDVAP